MNASDFRKRTQAFALAVIKAVEALPRTRTAEVIGKQLLRSGTAVGANYRACCRARSRADFIAKMGIVEEEADECIYWLELLIQSGAARDSHVAHLMDEAQQLLSMTVASIRTARGGNPQSAIRNPQLVRSAIRNPQSVPIRNSQSS